MDAMSVNEQSLIQTALWSLDVVCCAIKQDYNFSPPLNWLSAYAGG